MQGPLISILSVYSATQSLLRVLLQACLLEGKAFVHRSNNDQADTDATTEAFRQYISLSSVEQEISLKMSFFTLRFKDRFIESRVCCFGAALIYA